MYDFEELKALVRTRVEALENRERYIKDSMGAWVKNGGVVVTHDLYPACEAGQMVYKNVLTGDVIYSGPEDKDYFPDTWWHEDAFDEDAREKFPDPEWEKFIHHHGGLTSALMVGLAYTVLDAEGQELEELRRWATGRSDDE